MSFAQEMKDFIGGWSAVSEMKQKKDGLDLQRQQIEDLKAYRDATLALDEKKFALQEKNSVAGNARAAVAAGARGDKAAASAANDVYEGLAYADSWSEDSAIPADEGLGGYARGGLVRHMAGGGILEEDPDMPFIDPENPYVDPKLNVPVPTPAPRAEAPRPSAIPEEAPAPAMTAMGDATGEEASAPQTSEPNPEAVAATVATAQEATAAVANDLVASAKEKPAAIGGNPEEESMDIIRNKGGLSPQEWQELVTTIDPNGTIPSYLKSAAVLSSTYKYFMEHGQPEKAARIAKGILIANKQMTQTLGALAEHAAEQGDMESASKLISDAADSFPTGHQFSVQAGENGLTYSIKENGKVVEQGELSTDQFWQLAGKVKDGSLYVEEMGRIAESYNGGGSPEQALEVVSGSYVEAMNAKTAFENAELDGVSGKELETLRAAASNAAAVYQKNRSKALKAGIKSSDINASNKDAFDLALPGGEPAPAGEAIPTESGGLLDTAMSVGSAALDAVIPSRVVARGVSAASEAPGVTPEGNEVDYNSLPAPKTAEEHAALPSGTMYIAPNGEVKVKK